MTSQARRSGREAEERVFRLASGLGDTEMATPTQDHGEKTDVIFEGHRLQVSVSRKSGRQRRSLEKRGIVNVPAGEQIEDGTIISFLKSLIGLD